MDIYDTTDEDLEAQRILRLEAFSAQLMAKRLEAVNSRRMSGIEQVWQEDDEYYHGIDDANRNESYLKPSSSDGRLTYRDRTATQSTRSTVFANITAPYVDMAAARASDMLLPTEDKPFSISPTPVPDIKAQIGREDVDPETGEKVGNMAQQFMDEANTKSEKAETQIWDWLVESGWHQQMRKVIEQSARIGVGVLKGPYPVKRKNRKMLHQDSAITIVIEEELQPETAMVDAWDIYPDPACGEDIHSGQYIFERGNISAKQLASMKGGGYIDSQIDLCLEEGALQSRKESSKKKKETEKSERYEIWHYYGSASKKDLEASGCQCDSEGEVNVCVSMVNDRVIKASLSVFESGDFPYDVIQWQARQDSWAGTGVARQVRTSQNKINAAWRNLLDNAGVSAGPQIIMKDGVVYPADGVWEITPMKIWRVDDGADINDVRTSITSIAIPSMQVELQNIITMALDFAERATSMPLLLQGQQGAATGTVGGMQILQNNGNTVLRRVAKMFDDKITIPHIKRYYEWLMLYGNDDEAKGDFDIIAHGSSSFYERDAQNQSLMQIIQLAANPAYGIDPMKISREILKMNKINPDRILADEQQQPMQQEAPPDHSMEIAQLKAETEMKKAELTQQSDAQEIALKKDSMQAEMALKLQMAREAHAHNLALKKMELDIKMLELSQAQQISLDSIKASLAATTMKLDTQKMLSSQDVPGEAATPPTEPYGKAPTGQAYEM